MQVNDQFKKSRNLPRIVPVYFGVVLIKGNREHEGVESRRLGISSRSGREHLFTDNAGLRARITFTHRRAFESVLVELTKFA